MIFFSSVSTELSDEGHIANQLKETGPGESVGQTITSNLCELANASGHVKNVKQYKKKCLEFGLIIGNKTCKINKLTEQNVQLTQRLKIQYSDDELLSTSDLSELKTIPDLVCNDMTFVREALCKLYKNDLNKLKLKSLTGRKPRKYTLPDGTTKQSISKEPLTPTKIVALTSLYEARVGLSDRRRKSLNNHISNSLLMINKKRKPWTD